MMMIKTGDSVTIDGEKPQPDGLDEVLREIALLGLIGTIIDTEDDELNLGEQWISVKFPDLKPKLSDLALITLECLYESEGSRCFYLHSSQVKKVE